MLLTFWYPSTLESWVLCVLCGSTQLCFRTQTFIRRNIQNARRTKFQLFFLKTLLELLATVVLCLIMQALYHNYLPLLSCSPCLIINRSGSGCFFHSFAHNNVVKSTKTRQQHARQHLRPGQRVKKDVTKGNEQSGDVKSVLPQAYAAFELNPAHLSRLSASLVFPHNQAASRSKVRLISELAS